ncbi:hypothetical protein RB10620 [Rhodopirellula baltica SH 1]|uniref:Uncharacterized protein n=1 Tax=Rhodopirellula baltica (strain DSM 10527 / NCIMB 13988 / SH1) TaxID=243090 RepID=Q7UKI1_RHOBA|nr:hypothetical protein RB10620 [Rhodopirellula baltica SH 1]
MTSPETSFQERCMLPEPAKNRVNLEKRDAIATCRDSRRGPPCYRLLRGR